jgi:hypothetical protein
MGSERDAIGDEQAVDRGQLLLISNCRLPIGEALPEAKDQLPENPSFQSAIGNW